MSTAAAVAAAAACASCSLMLYVGPPARQSRRLSTASLHWYIRLSMLLNASVALGPGLGSMSTSRGAGGTVGTQEVSDVEAARERPLGF